MKIEIEQAYNGYIVNIPPQDENEIGKKFVVQESSMSDEIFSDSLERFDAFEKLVNTLQDIFGVNNSKHNSVGYVQGLCSEHLRLELQDQMKKSLENPKNNNGD